VIQFKTGTNEVLTFPFCDSVHHCHIPNGQLSTLVANLVSIPVPDERRAQTDVSSSTLPQNIHLTNVTLLLRLAYAFRSSSASLFHPCHTQSPSASATNTPAEILPSFNPRASNLFLRQRATPVAGYKWKNNTWYT
jgi:hypothetical protein